MQLFLSRVAICRFIIRRLIAAVRLALNATLEKIKEKGCPAAAQRLERAQLTAAPRVRASGRPPIRAACGPGGLPRAQLTAVFFSLHSLSANCWPDDWHGNESFKTRPWLPSESPALESYGIFRVFRVFPSRGALKIGILMDCARWSCQPLCIHAFVIGYQ